MKREVISMMREKGKMWRKMAQSEEGFVILAVLVAAVVLLGGTLFFYHTSIVERIFLSPSLVGNKMGDSAVREVTVVLPADYYINFAKRYPVIYYLPGFNADDKAEMEVVGKAKVCLFLDTLRGLGRIKDFILVSVDPKNKLILRSLVVGRTML